MLEFSAREYAELSYQFGLILATLGSRQPAPNSLSNAVNQLLKDASALGLVVTQEHLGKLLVEIVKSDPTKARFVGNDLKVETDELKLDWNRLCHHIEAAFTAMKAELGSVSFKFIPRDA